MYHCFTGSLISNVCIMNYYNYYVLLLLFMLYSLPLLWTLLSLKSIVYPLGLYTLSYYVMQMIIILLLTDCLGEYMHEMAIAI